MARERERVKATVQNQRREVVMYKLMLQWRDEGSEIPRKDLASIPGTAANFHRPILETKPWTREK